MKNHWHSLCHYPLPLPIFFFILLILLLNLIEIAKGNSKLDNLLAEDVDGRKIDYKPEFEAFKEGQQTNEKAYLHLQRVFLSNLLYVRNLASRMENTPILQARRFLFFVFDNTIRD